MTGIIRVLYVDDEPDLLEISRLFLEMSGDFSVVTAESAATALELLKSEHFDAVVSDYQMPGMDGIRFLIEVRSQHGRVPFILFTGKGREEIVVEALNNGADFYLQKGGEPEAQYAELAHKIRMAFERYSINKAFHESEEKYRRIVETAYEGIWAMDGLFVTTYVNERMAEMLGYTVEEMLGRSVRSYMPDVENSDHELKMEQHVQGQPGSYIGKFRAKDGTIRTCHVSTTPLFGDEGSFHGSFAMFTDITDRMHAEDELRRSKEEIEASLEELASTSEELRQTMGALSASENLYRTLFKEMLNGLAVHEIICDKDGTPRDYRFIDVNPAFEQMTGLSRGDIIGRTVLELMPDTEPFWIERYGRVALTGSPDHFDNYSQVLHKFFEVMVYQNAPAQFTTLIADVTDRRSAVEALKESERRYRNLYQYAQVALFETSLGNATVIACNQRYCDLFGFATVDDALGKDVLHLYANPEAREEIKRIMREQGYIKDHNVRFRNQATGMEFWGRFSARIDPARDVAEGSIIDITEQRRMEEDAAFNLAVLSSQQETSPDAILVVGEDGRILNYNQKFVSLWEIPAEVIASRSDQLALQYVLEKLVDPDAFLERVNYLYTHKDETSHEEIRLRDGRILERLSSPIRGDDGKLYGRVWYFSDITDRSSFEEKLRESEAHLSEAQKLAKIGSWEYDFASGKISWTRQTFPIFDRDPLMGEPSFEEMAAFWHKDDLLEFVEAVRLAGESGTPYDLEQRIIPQSGIQKYIRAQGEAVWENGVIIKLWGTVQDITPRKTAEVALRRNEEQVRRKLETLLSPSGDIGTLELAEVIDAREIQSLMNDFYSLTGIGIAILDIRGTILVATGWQDICTMFHRADPRSCRHCQESDVFLSRETTPGSFRMYKCRNNMWDIVTPIVVGGNHIGNLFLGQFLFEDEVVDYGLFRSHARKYGFNEEEYIAALDRVPRWSHEKVTTVMDFYTRFAGIISTLSHRNIQLARVVTERDHLVNSLQESEVRFRSYFDNAPYGVFIADGEGHYIETNPAASGITGYSHDELVTMSIPDLVPPESREQGAAHFLQLFAEGLASGEFLFRHKNGTLRYWSVDAVRLSPTRFIGFVQDITVRKRAEKALAESEEVFRELFNNANDAIFLHEMLPGGLPGRYFRVNDIACERLGYSREELSNMSPPDIVAPKHREKIPDIAAEIKSKGSATFEAIYERKDGSQFPVEVNTHLFVLQGRQVALSISRDITTRKQAEEALSNSEREYRELIEYANEAIIVAQDGMLKLVNARMAELTGYTREELRSTPFTAFIHQDDRAMVVERHHKRLRGERIPSRYMFRLTGKDGETRWVEISSVAVDFEGHPATLNYLTDITERRQTEEALRQSEEFNRGLVENIPDLVVVYGHDRKVRYVNQAADRVLGHSQKGRVGTDILSYVVPEKRAEIGEIVEDRLISGSTKSLEVEIEGNDNQRMTMITHSTPVQYHDEKAVLLLLTDISDRKALENQLVARAEELNRVSTSLAMANKKLNLLGSLTRHDIINKLTLISGFASQLQKKVHDPELSPYFEKQENAVRRIYEYLQFTRTYEEIGIKAPDWLNVIKMVKAGFAAIPHGAISLDGDLDGITVYADPLFEKVFSNLLDNSIRHGGHVTRVKVSSHTSDAGLIIYWEDDGVGVPAGEKVKIFERGFGKNTGLGLFLVREILDITGISIRETGEPGTGARFEIKVPDGKYRQIKGAS